MNNGFNLEQIAKFEVAADSAKAMKIGIDVFKINIIYSTFKINNQRNE